MAGVMDLDADVLIILAKGDHCAACGHSFRNPSPQLAAQTIRQLALIIDPTNSAENMEGWGDPIQDQTAGTLKWAFEQQ